MLFIYYFGVLCALVSQIQARILAEEPIRLEPVPVDKKCNGEWTQFFDRDNPSGYYDYESLADIQIEYPGKVCANPIGIDARLTNGAHYTTSGETVTVSPSLGLICKNSDQKDKRCEDYMVRFCCPREVQPKCPEGAWTQWFDRDNPGGYGDYETLSDLQTENPGKICPSPSAIDAALLDGTPYTASGQVVTIGPSIGLYCKNSDQKEGKCKDYKVRFCCYGAAVCPNKEDWTPWFDRDNPSGYYDWEGLASIQAENPGKVCERPIAVEGQLLNGADYTTSGEQVSIGPLIGLYCKNDLQTDKRCEDYRVRFCCPKVPSPCREEDWTPWFDRDNPSGQADYEALAHLQAENPGKICQNPSGVEAQTVGGLPYTSTGDIVSVGPNIGLTCYNADQPDKKCEDYKVRFCCSKPIQEPPSCPEDSWTQWFDRDNPGGYGDYETLAHLQEENPGKICPSPSAIDVQLTNGSPVSAGGDVVHFSSATGFWCVNSEQPDKRCNDYKVRFCCFGESACPSNKWTQWFDRDNPSGYWDWEGLSSIQNENPGKVCANPTAVDAQLTNGAPYTDGNDQVSIGPSIGLTCENAAQNDRRCNDYRVRFCCAADDDTPICPGNAWTSWFDRDNPGGVGDWETLSSIQEAYPGRVCNRPTAVDAQLTSGRPYTDGGDIVVLSLNGLYCVNNQQSDGSCNDYRVRFCCPKDTDQKEIPLPDEAKERQNIVEEAAPSEKLVVARRQ